jgi:dTDP-4-amino-4,6-dideoxygalactose transaminase
MLETSRSRLKPYLGSGEPDGFFLFAMSETPADLDAVLAKAWTSPLGITKLFMHAIGRYEAMAPLMEPSPTPNAERLAATTLTITTSGFMTEADMSAIAEAVR